MIESLAAFTRFATGLRAFLKDPLSEQDAQHLLRTRLRERESSFLQLVRGAIYDQPRSPYRTLLNWAGIGYEDIARMVKQSGIAAALSQLHEAGVYVSLEEFKGRQPIVRPGLERAVDAHDFDNTLAVPHFRGATGGSRGAARLAPYDFELLTHDAAVQSTYLQTFHLQVRPMAVWRPAPPGAAGIRRVLMQAKLGRPAVRWFSQHRPSLRMPRSWAITVFTAAATRVLGNRVPSPEHYPLGRAGDIARWLEDQCAAGHAAVLDTNVSSAIRVCQAAKELGRNISGTFFRLGSEPYTMARSRIVLEAGCHATIHYAMAEAGTIGVGCGSPDAPDDVHLLEDKIELIERSRPNATDTAGASSLFLTTLLPSTPKVMLNVESGDHATVTTRSCGCLLDSMGYRRHIHSLRSYEKLTTEGMHFLGDKIVNLIDKVLPATFGGYPTDYQLVERQCDGLARVGVIVSPKVGKVDESRIGRVVLENLGSLSHGDRMMAQLWEQAKTLEVIRQEPYQTPAAKILPLYIIREG